MLTEQFLQAAVSLPLGGEGLHPTVGGGAENRYPEPEACKRIAGAGAAADISGAAGEYAGFRSVRAAGAELDHSPAAGDLDNARRLGGDQSLKGDGRSKVSFDDLRNNKRRPDGENGFSGEDRGPFGHGEHVSGEAKSGQVFEESGASPRQLRQALKITDLFKGEMEAEKIFDRLLEARGDEEVPVVRQAPDKEFESSGLTGFARREIARGHRDLVEIGE